ncbi:MAG TPA: hypothetical protein VEL51_14365 [Vicinamibacterales bacterium]|nr:hypothetical protein [Vicinamibacterales bacterium]
MNAAGLLLKWIPRFILLYVVFIVCFVIGSMPVAGVMPDSAKSEPGLVSATSGLLIIALANLFVVAALILTSRWGGWKLAVSLALAYYGAVTFLPQIETWYFLSSITVGPQLLPRLFVMGIPTAFLFIPLAVWVLGKRRARADASPNPALVMPIQEWIWKLATVAVAYLVLYWGAGYFIAWQNPELRAFYGQPGEALPFFTQTANTLRHDPMLFPLQILRGLLWVLCALPVIRGSRVNPWWTALLVGLLFSAPQNLGQILANPLMPVASVRLSHMIETASSTFLFGTLVVWLLHREHHSIGDLIGIHTDHKR